MRYKVVFLESLCLFKQTINRIKIDIFYNINLPKNYNTDAKTGEDAAGGDVDNEIEPNGGFRQNEHIPSARQVTAPIGTRAELRCRIENSKF